MSGRLSRVKKLKPCKWCRELFTPAQFAQIVCTPACGIAYARMQEQKKADRKRFENRRELRLFRRKSRTITQLLHYTQKEWNKFILQRDWNEGCISCHMPASYAGPWHAGHYRTTKAAPQLRFHPDNVFKQCSQCNVNKSGNIVEYRKRLVQKIGVERVEAIENDNRIVRWDRDDVIAKRKEFLDMWKKLKAGRRQ